MKDDPHAKQSVFPPLCSLFRQVIALFPVLLISNDSRDFHYPSNRSHLFFFFSFFFLSNLCFIYIVHLTYMRINIWRFGEEEIIIYRGKIRKHFYSDNKLYYQESSSIEYLSISFSFLFFSRKRIFLHLFISSKLGISSSIESGTNSMKF